MPRRLGRPASYVELETAFREAVEYQQRNPLREYRREATREEVDALARQRQELEQELKRLRSETASERQELERQRRDIKRDRQKLERQQQEIACDRQRLAFDRQELEHLIQKEEQLLWKLREQERLVLAEQGIEAHISTGTPMKRSERDIV